MIWINFSDFYFERIIKSSSVVYIQVFKIITIFIEVNLENRSYKMPKFKNELGTLILEGNLATI